MIDAAYYSIMVKLMGEQTVINLVEGFGKIHYEDEADDLPLGHRAVVE